MDPISPEIWDKLEPLDDSFLREWEAMRQQPTEINTDGCQVGETEQAPAVASQDRPHQTMSTLDELLSTSPEIFQSIIEDPTLAEQWGINPIALSEYMQSTLEKLLSNNEQPEETNIDDCQVDEMKQARVVESQDCLHQRVLGEDKRWRSTLTKEQRSEGWIIIKIPRNDGIRSDKIYIHKQSDWRFRSEIEVDGFFLDGLGPKHIQRKAQMQGQDNTPNASVAKKRGRRERNREFQPSKSKPGLSDLRIPLLRDSNNLVLYDIVMKPPKDTTSKATQPKRQKQ